ncbi:DUF6265 family protein [Novosphingobium beihaiensis]|uniref:DUF1311 domain-containing protein n=1 Tax=Novosphingobium beihaiensis TaxID=2930389 RepID=A0ABT0BVW5_9SPHN|nr:DUF6265 family protein [Novosphingobium beihaiensis]MCJ2189193.1 DUF1311 domain-containing protein [Novosphingobium beihaiensis]
MGKWLPLLLCLSSLPAQGALAQETRTASEGHSPPRATVSQLRWLAGQWEGPGINGAPARESWFAPVGGIMTGMFVQEDGKGAVRFTEFVQIAEKDGSLVLRVKHFNPDLTGWEEKGTTEDFPLVAMADGAAYFDGLTIRRDGRDGMLSAVRMERKDGSVEELEFRYHRPGTAAEAGRCPDAMTTLDINACLGGVLGRADVRRKAYLEKALAREADRPELQAMIRTADKAFDAYRTAHCDAVYEDWKEGTIRGAMSLSCQIAMTDARTHRIWQDWLTYMDSTPPVLPEPGPTP